MLYHSHIIAYMYHIHTSYQYVQEHFPTLSVTKLPFGVHFHVTVNSIIQCMSNSKKSVWQLLVGCLHPGILLPSEVASKALCKFTSIQIASNHNPTVDPTEDIHHFCWGSQVTQRLPVEINPIEENHKGFPQIHQECHTSVMESSWKFTNKQIINIH